MRKNSHPEEQEGRLTRETQMAVLKSTAEVSDYKL